MTSFTYDSQRQKTFFKNRFQTTSTVNNRLSTQFTPTPWNINFTLSIFVKNADDGTQIIEQILPYFNPEWTVSMNLVPEMQIKQDIPFVLQSTNMEDTYEGDFETRRALVWNLDFMCKAWYFGPIGSQGIIRRSITNLYAVTDPDALTGDEEYNARLDVTPALTANGEPTTDSSQSIPIEEINADDPFGFAVDIDEQG